MSESIFTKRLHIRPLTPQDAEAMFSYRSDAEIRRYQNWEPSCVDEIRDFITDQAELGSDSPGRWRQLGLFLRRTDQLAGDVGLHVQAHDPQQVEVGITLAPACHGQGLASEALTAMLGYLFGDLGKHRVFGSVDPRNTKSLALLERVGMRREAHFRESYRFKGAWADDVVYAMLRREYMAALGGPPSAG